MTGKGNEAMKSWHHRFFSLFVLGYGLGCNAVAGIQKGLLAECVSVADCTVDVSSCRSARCEASQCIYENAPEGTSVPEQALGDCLLVVCDGTGKTKAIVAENDVSDDGDPCTVDACQGAKSIHVNALEVVCYAGPRETLGVGACTAGIQQCDGKGQPIGGCKGQTLPQTESYVSTIDDDCDGQVNEDGEGCICEYWEVRPCYSGPAGTQDVGICHGGMQGCRADGLGYGTCALEQVPEMETCSSPLDDDCDGLVNEEGPDCQCGDGVVSAPEECDDGNADSTDACTVQCKLPACGDGVLQPGAGEACDDGNLTPADDCTNLCQLPTCGDGWIQYQYDETCDDGNTDSSDACTALCKPALCGDGFVQAGTEECDDTNINSSDGCTKNCKVSVCGDGVQQPFESCDDGNTADGDACPANCLRAAVDIVVSQNRVCARLASGELKCWGGNENGELGQGDTFPRTAPNQLGDLLPPVDLGTGKHAVQVAVFQMDADYFNVPEYCGKQLADYPWMTCALLNDGSVKCWGAALGYGDVECRGDGANEMADNLAAIDLGTGKHAVAIAPGACALLNDGTVKCWGNNEHGQLGLGDVETRGDQPGEMGDALPPVNLGTGKLAVAISGNRYHRCAVLDDGSVKCWGWNKYGQLGVESTGIGEREYYGNLPSEMGENLPAVRLGTGKAAVAVAVGKSHTCAILSGGTVKCWGAGGLLGLGDKLPRGTVFEQMGDNLPEVDLGAGRTAVAIAADDSTCVLLDNGSVKCWGAGIGDEPAEMGDFLQPVALGSNKKALRIATVWYNMCALMDDGTIRCFGSQLSNLGTGGISSFGKPEEMGDHLPPIPP